MSHRFTIGREKIDVEYWVDAPLRGKFETVIDCGHHLNDFKWSMSLGRKLGGRLMCAEMTPFQPHEVSCFILGRILVFDP